MDGVIVGCRTGRTGKRPDRVRTGTGNVTVRSVEQPTVQNFIIPQQAAQEESIIVRVSSYTSFILSPEMKLISIPIGQVRSIR